MIYLRETMTKEEARKAYRELAKQLHPDAGGTTEEFQVLTAEYTAIIKGEVKIDLSNDLDSLMKTAGEKADILLDIMKEAYPRTQVHMVYDFRSIEVYLEYNTVLPKMLHIERIIKDFGYFPTVITYFKWNGSRKRYTLYTDKDTTYVNMKKGESFDFTDAKRIYNGRRYKLDVAKRYSVLYDLKEKTKVIMHNTPKFTLLDLWKGAAAKNVATGKSQST